VPQQLTLLTSHSRGLTAGTPNATLEAMLHRRAGADNASNQFLIDDNSTVTSTLLLLLHDAGDTAGGAAAAPLKALALHAQHPPLLLYGAAAAPAAAPTAAATSAHPSPATSTSALVAAAPGSIKLPPSIHLQNLDLWDDGRASADAHENKRPAAASPLRVLLRLANVYDAAADGHGSAAPTATVDISAALAAAGLRVGACEERALSGVFPPPGAAGGRRWRSGSGKGQGQPAPPPSPSQARTRTTGAVGSCQVDLSPLDIKTFIVTIDI
jgi:hypothetical protein